MLRFFFILLFSTTIYSQSIVSNPAVHHHKNLPYANYALDFDGSNDYILVNGGKISNAWSVEVWHKKSGTSSRQNLTNKANSNVSSSWALRLGQWYNKNKVGITKYGRADYYINDSRAQLETGKWEHVAWTYQSNNVTVYVNGESLGSSFVRGPLSPGAILYWNIIGKSSGTIKGELDELRIWNDKRTAEEITENMFMELNGNESNLVAYYNMNKGTGFDVEDNSQNTYDGQMKNMSEEDWVLSNAPLGSINDSYKTNIKAIWEKSSTSASSLSDGLSMISSTGLAEENYTIYGNNGLSSTSSLNLPPGENLSLRSARVWQFDVTGIVSIDITIDIGDATGYSGPPVLASDFRLLYRPVGCTGDCNFQVISTASSVSSTDNIEFTNVSLQNGFYAIGTLGGEL